MFFEVSQSYFIVAYCTNIGKILKRIHISILNFNSKLGILQLMNETDLNNCKKALGYRISELRKKVINPETNKPISQEELGLRTGHAKKTIGELERGNTNPRYDTLLVISKELNVTIQELFDFDMKKYVKLSNKS